MIKNKQLISDSKKGDCFRACWTSILEIPNDPKLPNCDDPEWFLKLWNLFGDWGMTVHTEHKAMWRQGYWIASVPSKNYKGVSHAIVMKGHFIAFDPSTKKRYRTGRSLLGKGIVTECNFFEVTDPSLLKNFIRYKEKVCKS